jgi:hypothetical protein
MPVIPPEKLDALINGISGIIQAVKDLNNAVSGIHAELKDLRKEQKGTSSLLRNINENIDNLKEKRSWFKFS